MKLAKEAIFGEEIMRKCTPGGTRELPGLPRKELYEIKKRKVWLNAHNSGETRKNLKILYLYGRSVKTRSSKHAST